MSTPFGSPKYGRHEEEHIRREYSVRAKELEDVMIFNITDAFFLIQLYRDGAFSRLDKSLLRRLQLVPLSNNRRLSSLFRKRIDTA